MGTPTSAVRGSTLLSSVSGWNTSSRLQKPSRTGGRLSWQTSTLTLL